ncbi:DUF3320 domain-containing protein [Derxia lacustris]|uniref:DUF3320 domain-containing protein n=1 Tax=Derxia lacustris TaxID=764842 RepID=UPI000A1752A4|nr:DUF3320 domain-containing protein [Derxia lacustris]
MQAPTQDAAVQEPAVQEPVAPPPAAPRLQIALAGKLNLADFQNAVPLLRDLAVVNETADPLRALELRIDSEPPFLRPRSWHLDALAPGETRHLPDRDIALDGALLTRLTEAETASVRLLLLTADGTRELARHEQTIELLPRNQWGGLAQLPDIVAAFVQPNEPSVDRLLKQAAEALRANGRSPAIDGYKAGPKRAWELSSAIWNTVGSLGLVYALPPASFEYSGQKVRSITQILDARLGTCLDLALMFCSVIEQAGLHPLLVFTRGHAFAGVWLRPEEFSTVVVDDASALRKRIKLGELVLFETTIVTHRPVPSFTHATELGTRQVGEEHDESFELVIDIRRARLQRIKPLASADAGVQGGPDDAPVTGPGVIDDAPPQVGSAPAADDEAPVTPGDRITRWQRKLLDLSMRNPLLNFKAGKKALTLDAPDPGQLEDLLAEGKALRLLPRPALMDGSDPRSREIHEGRSHEDVRRAHAREALLQRSEVFVDATDGDLEGRLVELFRSARSTLQEGGSNTLFLALGFLSWIPADKPAKGEARKYRAPLVLVPVTLDRKSVRSGFTLKLHDDEPRFNPTLLEMLRQDFQLALPGLDGAELPKDEAGLDIGAIWRTVSQAVRDIPGWEVTEEVALAMFSFAKYLMWKDLSERTDQLRESPVVRHLIDTPRDGYGSGGAFPARHRLDAEFSPEQTFCPLPADSSQLAAVMAAARGKDFVLIGPPGTGKSQTIANLIAQCLAEGKKVLFVSEKITALDVVYRRLREVGLGEFCLELHSSKARKLDVLEQLKQAWAARGDGNAEAWRDEAQRLQGLRTELNRYVERLHWVHGNGMTVYEAIGRVVAGSGQPLPELRWAGPQAHDKAAMQALRAAVDRLAVNATAVGMQALRDGPFARVDVGDWSPAWQQALIDAARKLDAAALVMQQAGARLASQTGLPAFALLRRERQALALLGQLLPQAAGQDWRFALATDARAIADRLRDGLALLARHRALNARISPAWNDALLADADKALALLRRGATAFAALGQPWPADTRADLARGLALLGEIADTGNGLSVRYGEAVERLNLGQLQRDWAKAESAIWPLSSLGKKKVRGELEAAMADGGEPDPARDLPLLARLRTLRADLAALDPGPLAAEVWLGLRSKPAAVQAALRLQVALVAARAEQPWDDSGLEPVADGRCGEALRAELTRLRSLAALRAEIEALDRLRNVTDGAWNGLATAPELFDAALAFQRARRAVAASGVLAGEHAAVARGELGTVFSADLATLRERDEIERQLAALAELAAATGQLWNGLATRVELVEQALKFQAGLAAAVAQLAGTPQGIGAVTAPLMQLLGEGNALLDPAGAIADAGKTVATASSALTAALDGFAGCARFADGDRGDLAELGVAALQAHCAAIAGNEHRLRAWCGWRGARAAALALGLLPLIEAVERGSVAPDGIGAAFETAYARWWLNAVVDDEPVIRGFVSAEHEKRIGDFRQLDRRFVELTRSWVKARLCADLPAPDEIGKNVEWGLLRREMNKKARHIPLRQLVAGIPTALSRLTPCLLMSPLSIAQFLPASASLFDVVVFDEASQIPVWDAIGAMARGRQVVMVGDPKQLPPSNFFGRSDAEEDDEDVEGDLDSILDECLGANLPTLDLSWHYRSRSENLIAFSNHRYYDGKLVTFPSPATDDRAVSFHAVNGSYAKGGARTNQAEAKALVADLVARLKSPGFRASGLTVGVVTFNTEQMKLIQDLLDEECRRDPSIESHFAETQLEPVFVKNLESVQGDERDLMYFSITYGPDPAGRLSMNFGPMNKDGGERRLNVAITRARQELRVFSTLRADQMDLSRTQAAGVRDLKHFLEFAERGPRALAEATRGSLGGFESPFEEAVAAALAGRGWLLQTQIGASSFRIDLAVVDPDAPGRYLAGVECDGATYHRSATARDRDLLREQVLRGLGWEIVRIWSTDWWTDPVGTLDRTDARLRVLLEEAKARRALAEVVLPEPVEAPEAPTLPSTEPDGGSPTRRPDDTAPPPIPVEPPAGDEAAALPYAGMNDALPLAGFGRFEEADPTAVARPDADAFHAPGYDATLAAMICHVVGIEGPVLDEVLARRIGTAHGWGRTGKLIRDRVVTLARLTCRVTTEATGEFFWPLDSDPAAPAVYRSPPEGSSRTIKETCDAELVALAGAVLASGASGDAALARMTQELGLKRLVAATRERLEASLRQAAQH